MSKPKKSPERTFYEERYGKMIMVVTIGGETFIGVLCWVDRYSICLNCPISANSEIPKQRVILYKHAIESVGDEVTDDDRGQPD